MELDTAHSIEVITVSTSSSPGTSVKKVVPLQIDLERFPVLDKDDSNKLRRPVRPIDRQRMRPWLMELLDLGNVFGLRWTNRHQGIFQISWRHASRLGWNLETDGDVFERWARHTGIYKEGDPPEPKRWKANFRCALHSLHDVVELTNAVERRGRNACRTYRFLQSNDELSLSRKRAKARRAKALLERPYEKIPKETVQPLVIESGSSEEVISDSEPEESTQDKVIVQKLDSKSDLSVEDYFLHHDHDYAGPDKTQKTILLRQGIGSIVLHKEMLSAPEETEEEKQLLMSNLDQLASAAVSSASLQSTPVTKELTRDHKERKSSRIAKSSTAKQHGMIQVDNCESFKSDLTSQHLLIGTKLMEDDQSQTNRIVTRKRKHTFTESSSKDSYVIEPMTLRKSDRRKTSELVTTPVKVRSTDSNKLLTRSPSALTLTRRTSSPKILCRRSKRHKSKSDKNISESTEPLMSSCLLLLEAATRLDNEEKMSTSSSSNTNHDEQNSSEAVMNQNTEGLEAHNLSDSSSEKRADTATVDTQESLDRAYRNQSFEPFSIINSPGILRSALENADKPKSEKGETIKSKTIRNFLKDSSKLSLFNTVSVSERKIVVSEAPFAKGLFSGSTIQSNSQPSPNEHKKMRGNSRLSRTKSLLSNQTDIQSDSVVGEEEFSEKERHVMFSIVEPQTPAPTIKSNSGVQQLVIQRALPVLSPPIQKTVPPRFETSAPVVVTQSLSHSRSSSHILMSSDKTLSSSKVIEQGGGGTVKSATPHVSLLNMEAGRPATTSNNVGQGLVSQLSFVKKKETVGSLVSVFSAPNLTQATLSSPEAQLQNSVTKVSSIKIAPTPLLRTVTFTMNSRVPTFSSSQRMTSKALPLNPQTFVSIPAKSGGLPNLHSAAAGQYVTSLKSSFALPQTLVLSSPHSTSQKEVLIIEQGKASVNEVKVHYVPMTNSSQLKQHADVAISAGSSETTPGGNSPLSTQRGTIHSFHVPAQVVIDPSKGTFIKIPTTNVFQTHSLSQTVSDSPIQPFQIASSTSSSAMIETSSANSVLIADKASSTVESIPMNSFLQPVISAQGSGVLSRLNVLNTKVVNSQQVIDTAVHPSTSCSDSTDPMEKIVDSKVATSSISLLPRKSLNSIGGSSIVLDFQQALQAHKMTQALANVTRVSGDLTFPLQSATPEGASVKSLAELCKRYLSHLFSSLDGQTSDSDENDSVIDSPKIKIKEEYSTLTWVNHFTDKLQSASVQEQLSCMKSEVAAEDYKFVISTPKPSDAIGIVCNTSTASYFSNVEVASESMESNSVDESLLHSPEAAIDCYHPQQLEVGFGVGILDNSTGSGGTTQLCAPVASGESQDDYGSKLLMDPTTPLSLGEIPLFASSKSDIDS